MGGVPAQHRHRGSEHDGKSRNLEINQPRPPEGRRGADEAKYLGQQPDLDRLYRFEMVPQEREDYRIEGDKNHGPRYSECSNRNTNTECYREHPPEFEPVAGMHS